MTCSAARHAVAPGARHHRLADQGQVDLQPQEGAGAEDAGPHLCRRGEVRLAGAVPWSCFATTLAAQGLDRPLPTIAANGTHIGLAQPVIVRSNMHGRKSPGARGAQDPLPTITTDGGLAFAEPVIMNGRKGNQAKAVSTDPVPTLDTKGGVWLAEPLVLSQHNSGAARSAEDPLPTITTGGAATEDHPGCARPMLVEPFILNRHGDGYGESRAHSVEQPAPTANCDGGGYLVEPFVLSRHAEGAARSVDEPVPTQVAKHSHLLITSVLRGPARTAPGSLAETTRCRP